MQTPDREPKFEDLRGLPCTHCDGTKVSKNGYDECPWCDGFGTASMEARVAAARNRVANIGHHPGRRSR